MNKLAAMYIITGLLLYILGAVLLSTDDNLLSVAAFISGVICFQKARKEQDEI
jgi:hypothetical protein